MFIPYTHSAILIDIPKINAVTDLKLLGVIFNSNFNFNTHIDNVIVKATRNLYALRIVKPFISKANCTSVYFAIVRSHLEYCSSLFIGTSSRNQLALDLVQNRAHRIICGSHCNCNSFPPLSIRRRDRAIRLFLTAALDPSNSIHAIIPPASTLRANRFIQPFSRTSLRLNSIVPLVTSIINNL